jgi:hypothetical protein
MANNDRFNPTPRHMRLNKEQLKRKGQAVLRSEIERRKRLGIPIVPDKEDNYR